MSPKVRLTAVLVSVGLVLASVRPALADKLDDIRARGYLLVGVTKSSPPFSFLGKDGSVVGYDVDLADAVASSMGVSSRKVSIINSERISSLQKDRVDLVAVGMTRSKQRANAIAFSFAYLDSPHQILVRKSSGIARLAQLAGRKVALVRSASVDRRLRAAVPGVGIAFFDTYDEAFAALAKGAVDGFLADRMLLLWFAQKTANPAGFALIDGYTLPRTAGFALKKNEPNLLNTVNESLLKLEASGKAAKIYDKWFSPLPRSFRIQPD